MQSNITNTTETLRKPRLWASLDVELDDGVVQGPFFLQVDQVCGQHLHTVRSGISRGVPHLQTLLLKLLQLSAGCVNMLVQAKKLTMLTYAIASTTTEARDCCCCITYCLGSPVALRTSCCCCSCGGCLGSPVALRTISYFLFVCKNDIVEYDVWLRCCHHRYHLLLLLSCCC